MSFFESSFLWFEAVTATCAVAVVCAVTGLYALFRRVTFLPAALSQISGLGVVTALFLGAAVPSLTGTFLTNPWIAALGITLLAALLLGWMRPSRRFSREAMIAAAYIAASALVILISDRTPTEAHHIDDILFGNAVAVTPHQMWITLAVAGGVLLLHGVLFRPFLFASFDQETARAHGLPTRLLDGLLFLSMGLTIAVSTKTIGALPVFAFSVLPPLSALTAVRNTVAVFLIAPALGAMIAFAGYYLSFRYELPTGACTVTLAAFLFLVSSGTALLRRGSRAHTTRDTERR